MRWLYPFAAALCLGTSAVAEQTFGLVIGIDDYTYIPKLQGAANDARDIADALEGLEADVTLLLDQQVTRAAVLAAWEDILLRAEPGDRLIISYAGHGSNEPEQLAGNEADGRDENFLLAGFAPHGLAAGERIRDDEIAELIARRPDLSVIFVADACHAGTVTRNLNPTLGYRYVDPAGLEDDPLPPPPPPPATQADSDVALFLAAVHETEKVPEYLIDGKPRGALSYAFADGLRGAADTDQDQILTKGELETYIRRTVRQVSDGVQLPQSMPVGQEDTPLIALRGFQPEVVAPRPARFDDLPLLRLSAASMPPISGTQAVTGEADLRLVDGQLLSMVGDPIATIADQDELARAVDKSRLVAGLKEQATATPRIAFDRGNQRHLEGTRLTINVDQRQDRFLTLLNLAANGEIQLLYPHAEFGDPSQMPAGNSIGLTVEVTPPFGAEHIVAIETATAPTQLRSSLANLSGTHDMRRLWDALATADDSRVAVFPFFSAAR